jgi:hypothetical protein
VIIKVLIAVTVPVFLLWGKNGKIQYIRLTRTNIGNSEVQNSFDVTSPKRTSVFVLIRSPLVIRFRDNVTYRQTGGWTLSII